MRGDGPGAGQHVERAVEPDQQHERVHLAQEAPGPGHPVAGAEEGQHGNEQVRGGDPARLGIAREPDECRRGHDEAVAGEQPVHRAEPAHSQPRSRYQAAVRRSPASRSWAASQSASRAIGEGSAVQAGAKNSFALSVVRSVGWPVSRAAASVM